jgi:hypothetical protein
VKAGSREVNGEAVTDRGRSPSKKLAAQMAFLNLRKNCSLILYLSLKRG